MFSVEKEVQAPIEMIVGNNEGIENDVPVLIENKDIASILENECISLDEIGGIVFNEIYLFTICFVTENGIKAQKTECNTFSRINSR